MTEGIAITGVGAVTPLGNGAGTLYDRWTAGETGLIDGLGRCAEFDPERRLGRKEMRRLDRFSQMAVICADEALEQAGWTKGLPYPADRVACLIGTATGGAESNIEGYDVLRSKGPSFIPALMVPKAMANAAAAAIAIRFGLTGEAYSVVSACAASAQAVGSALRLLQVGAADAVVVGGSEAPITDSITAGFAKMGALSPDGVARPFDKRRDGFVLGEGAGVLVLENAGAARRRGARVLGEIVGYGASTDAYHLTAPDPTGTTAARAITQALDSAGAGAADVAYVNAHGTATPLNDVCETKALKLSLGKHAYAVPISSTKSVVGHLFGASGAVELIATVLTLRAGVAPPTLNLEQPDELCDLDYVPCVAAPLPDPPAERDGKRLGLSNSFGFGGHNSVIAVTA